MTSPAESLWLMRHGESTWNAAGRMQRQIAHPPLTARGLDQALTAAQRLRDSGIEQIVSSDAVRAIQTARAVSSVLSVPVSIDVRLRERGEAGPGLLEDPRSRVIAALRTIVGSGARTLVVTHGDIIFGMRDILDIRGGDTTSWRTGSDIPNGVVVRANLHLLRGRPDPVPGGGHTAGSSPATPAAKAAPISGASTGTHA
ncbi:phosphoglycerate mutase [Mycolicibacterium canariasense]|uniref:Phosphoglycerate mutase n=1 Tax=Mycolicibacterium canariasense TaxID=228230 RepID=A0A100WJN8_MYCCR|nr:phosphoglycerate mutase family protein [Mycolicibacterium canariasense]MCV7207989.1 histidine phosphatase family protein [Mycolicibacterium canariasense]ORV11140.1 hypothetical protein AWB94_06290 [Mycolicibacterium canariasense]GAS99268.1 phosphoglycerate mutase [Mycolicibacterium canariasense]